MGENVIMMVCCMLAPLTVMGAALVLWRFPPGYKQLGYHSSFAEKSPQTWAAAQQLFGVIGFFSNLAVLVLTVIAFVIIIALKMDESAGAMATTICGLLQVAAIFADVIAVEVKLRKLFDKDGQPK